MREFIEEIELKSLAWLCVKELQEPGIHPSPLSFRGFLPEVAVDAEVVVDVGGLAILDHAKQALAAACVAGQEVGGDYDTAGAGETTA